MNFFVICFVLVVRLLELLMKNAEKDKEIALPANLGVSFRAVQSVLHLILSNERVEARLVSRVLSLLKSY